MDVFEDFLVQITDKKSSRYFPLVLLALLSACENTSDAHQCEIQLTPPLSSADLAYTAKTKKEVCVSGAEVKYFVLVEAVGENLDHWFVELAIENDLRGGAAPTSDGPGAAMSSFKSVHAPCKVTLKCIWLMTWLLRENSIQESRRPFRMSFK